MTTTSSFMSTLAISLASLLLTSVLTVTSSVVSR